MIDSVKCSAEVEGDKDRGRNLDEWSGRCGRVLIVKQSWWNGIGDKRSGKG